MKKIYFILLLLFVFTKAQAQNWSNIGTPKFSAGTTSGPYKYFADMEIDAAGTVFVGYWDNGGKLNFVKSAGTGWSVLPSPGTCAVSFDDIEVRGTDYYMSYMGARGSNYYAFVKKYDGSSTWTFVGDSILIGGIGQGGSFDFLLDNNGVPTLIGLPKAVFSDKTVKQFISGAWITTDTIPNSASAIFKEGSATFDANNKLCVIMGGTKSLTVPPYLVYYTLGLKIDGSTDTVIGDTVYVSHANGKFKIDNAGNSYLLLNNALKPALLSYKLNGSKWDMISDTVGAVESMLSADVSNDGKVIFNTQTFSNFHKSIYMYSGGTRTRLDSINFNGVIMGGISDLIVYNGYVYVLFDEGDFTVMKHSLSASTNTPDLSFADQPLNMYPNPANRELNIELGSGNILEICIFDINGKQIFEKVVMENKISLDVSPLNKGIYFIQIKTVNGISNKKLIIQ